MRYHRGSSVCVRVYLCVDFSAPPSVLQASSLIIHIVCLCQELLVHNTRINLNENKEHAQSNIQTLHFVMKMIR